MKSFFTAINKCSWIVCPEYNGCMYSVNRATNCTIFIEIHTVRVVIMADSP